MSPHDWQRVVKALRDVASDDVAVEAAAELQAKATIEDVPRLIDLLNDDSFFVREAAAWPLSDLGVVEALPVLLDAYQRGLEDGHDNDGFSAALADLVSAKPDTSRRRLKSLVREARPGSKHAQWLLQFCEPKNDT
ncbi:MAG: HEAT repeat domain-containing protein [Pseudomonadota bacterium]